MKTSLTQVNKMSVENDGFLLFETLLMSFQRAFDLGRHIKSCGLQVRKQTNNLSGKKVACVSNRQSLNYCISLPKVLSLYIACQAGNKHTLKKPSSTWYIHTKVNKTPLHAISVET